MINVIQKYILFLNIMLFLLLLQVLEDEISRDDKFLSEENLQILLTEIPGEPPRRTSIVGYPSYPLFCEISHMIHQWMTSKKCPSLDLPEFELLDDKGHTEQKQALFQSILPLLSGLESLWSIWSQDEIKFRLRDILVLLGLRGILDLLGIRKTVGTKEILPPSRTALLNSFNSLQNEKAEITVGARALSKHFHRDSTSSWWGSCTGTEQAKNQHALGLCNKILDDAVWINIHWLPHDVILIEARNHQGYGVRWSSDGSLFRGFLEPQMTNGHEIGWKH